MSLFDLDMLDNTSAAPTLRPKDLKDAGSELLQKTSQKTRRRFYDLLFLAAFACCLLRGPFPSLELPLSLAVCGCFALSFFDENFYLYVGLFIYMRYKMMVGGTQAYRFFSYLMVVRALIDLSKTKFRIAYFSSIFVIALHSLLALPKLSSLKVGFNVIVDFVIAYLVVSHLVQNKPLMRKFIFAFFLGGIASGIYGFTSEDAILKFNVSGAGVDKVTRNFGALSDANFAGFVYTLCVLCAVALKNVRPIIRIGLLGFFAMLLLQTVSLSAFITLTVMLAVYIILKFRSKSAVILLISLVAAVVVIAILLSIPQFRQIEAVADLLIRLQEKLSYVARGRWDLLTTDRTSIWQTIILPYYNKQSILIKLFGGNVDTVHVWDEANHLTAVHNSYIQSVLNFGIFGTILVFLPLVGSLLVKLYRHFSQPSGYEFEDIEIIRILFVVAFLVFGMSVDFFVDWPYMMMYFM